MATIGQTFLSGLGKAVGINTNASNIPFFQDANEEDTKYINEMTVKPNFDIPVKKTVDLQEFLQDAKDMGYSGPKIHQTYVQLRNSGVDIPGYEQLHTQMLQDYTKYKQQPKENMSDWKVKQEKEVEVPITGLAGGALATGIGMVGKKIASKINPEITKNVSETISNLSNKLLGGVKQEDKNLVNAGVKAVADLFTDLKSIKEVGIDAKNIKFSDIADNFGKIKNIFYKNSGVQDKLSSFSIGYSQDAIDLLNKMKSGLEEATVFKGREVIKPQLGQENLYKQINGLLRKAKEGKLNGLDANEIKKSINSFFKGYTEKGLERSGLSAEGARNVYSRIKDLIEKKGLSEGITDIKQINKTYQGLFELEPYITAQSNKVSRFLANNPNADSIVSKLAKGTVNFLDLLTFKTGKNALFGALQALGFKPNQSISITEVEKQIPKILKEVSKQGAKLEEYNTIRQGLTNAVKTGKGLTKAVGKALFTIDPMNTPFLLEMVPGTVGETAGQFIQGIPGLQATEQVFMSPEELQKKQEERLNKFREELQNKTSDIQNKLNSGEITQDEANKQLTDLGIM